MIDIDASLQAIDTKTTFWVKFKDPSDEAEDIAFEVKASPREQRKLIDRSLKVSTNFRENLEAGTMQISSDWVALALALSDYIVGWEGFAGTFDQGKLKKWFEKFPSYGIAFAQNFKTLLDEYEGALVRRREDEQKN